MTKPLAKWIQKRYAVLWNRYHDLEFSFDDAKAVLPDKAGVNVFFSDLRLSGWVKTRLDEKDNRKRLYRLVTPEEGFAGLK